MKLHIVYFWSKGERNGYAESYYQRNTDKITAKDLDVIRKKIILEEDYDNLVILNWKELADV